VLVVRPEVGVGVEPEAVQAERADSAPGLALAIVNGLDVSHRTHWLDGPGGVMSQSGASGLQCLQLTVVISAVNMSQTMADADEA